jgi:alkylation response protein AidB-like acyl-CoA dehydrogenase
MAVLSREPVASEQERQRLVFFVRDAMRVSFLRAAGLDEDNSYPHQDIQALASAGALVAPIPPSHGGLGLGTTPAGALALMDILRCIGSANLALGRLFEGHVNALKLIVRFGTPAQIAAAADDAARGFLFGVWNTQGNDGVRLKADSSGWRLEGRKTFASGAGYISRPLVTASTENGALLMVLPRLQAHDLERRADLSEWQAHGMRASATGSYDFSGLTVNAGDIVGGDGDYHRQPDFSAGAWRFAAVQLGGIERLLDEARRHLKEAGRTADPSQLARVGEASIAAETARLFVERSADMAERLHPGRDPEQAVAYACLARSAVERAGLDMLELVHRSIGLAGFLRNNPIERVSRDLATYLRQPAPDRALAAGASYVLSRDCPTAELWQ